MKELSSAEYRTILTILANPHATDRERMRLAGLPSSTFNAARRRAFAQKWISEITIPDPGAVGFERVEFDVARPLASTRAALVQRWRSDPECVLLWSGMHSLLSVFFRSRASGKSPVFEGSGGEDLRRVEVNRIVGSVPIYFDYSGLWAKFSSAPFPAEYPSGLSLNSSPAAGRTLAAVRNALETGLQPEVPRRWMSILRRPRGHQHAVEAGLLQPRTVLEPWAVPPYDGRRIGEMILVRGRLRTRDSIGDFLNALTGTCGVYPFLLAEGEGNLVLGGLGQVRAGASGRIPVAAARAPVLGTVLRFIDPADIVMEPVEAVTPLVHHRYAAPRRDAAGRTSDGGRGPHAVPAAT